MRNQKEQQLRKKKKKNYGRNWKNKLNFQRNNEKKSKKN